MDLINFLENAIGPGTLKIKRVQLWDLYSRQPVYLDANLTAQGFSLFNYKAGDNVIAVNSVAASPPYRARKADTNIDAPNNNPYDMFVHGMATDVQNLQATPGTVGAANDKATWADTKQAILEDTELELDLNDTVVDKFTMIDAPAASGVAGYAAMGTTAALTLGASINMPSNGLPDSGNYRNYLNEGPFFIEANSTIKMTGEFGNSLLTANFIYKPAATLAPTVFIRAVLKGLRIWNI